jgi:ubiquinone/menaquinone biosynthesis C-methylase UbiE
MGAAGGGGGGGAGVGGHYARGGDDIAARILAALRAAQGADQGPDAPVTPEALAPLDHFHGRGVVATREMVALLEPRAGEEVLDIGCGIGGPARWIAARFGCRVTGVDLTHAFCRAAAALNAATGMAGRVRIVEGSALALPLPDAAFDRAYSQNVVMNIPDKAGFCREAFRVLKPGGVLALSNLGTGPGGAPHYPVPWASTPEASFLVAPEAMRAALEAAGFEILVWHDTTETVRANAVEMRRRLEAGGLPPLGLHVLMGERMREMQLNSARNAEEGRISATEVLARRPAAG